MSPRRRKRHAKDPASALAPIVKAHLEQIEWALTYGSNIVVFSDEPGATDHNYVRHVKDHPRPKTLQIGPVSIQEVDELAAFIQQLAGPEFSYPIRTIVPESMDANADC